MTEENVISTILWRRAQGIVVEVRTHPKIEQFMASLGEGMPHLDAAEFGRLWTPYGETKELPLYGIPKQEELYGTIRAGNVSYRIDQPAGRLSSSGDYGPVVNLSFLRLAGSSKGVSFLVNGVFGVDTVEELKNNMTAAQRAFYRNFMKPIRVELGVYTRDLLD